MKLTKFHRVLKFKESDWMKKYIDFNTKKRMNAAHDFDKDFFKLLINSVYGKTMENLRKRINVRLVNNEKDFLKYTIRPTYITCKRFSKDYVAIHEIKAVLILNKPIYIGITVLDLSTWKMYDFHYNFIKKNLDAELFFTDTDSLTYEIKSKDVYEEFFKWQDLFDKMKDEFGGVIVTEFVRLKSKMYSIKKINDKEHNTAKGVSIATEFNNFKDVLLNKKIIRHKMKRIQSKKQIRNM